MVEPVFTLQPGYKGFQRWLVALKHLNDMPLFIRNPKAKSVLSALVVRDSAAGCFPSVQTLCNDTSLCETAVKKALKELRSARLIEVVAFHYDDGRQGANRYKITFPWEVFEGEGSSHGPRGSQGDGGRGRQKAPEYTKDNLRRECNSMNPHTGSSAGATPVFGGNDMHFLFEGNKQQERKQDDENYDRVR